jgi:hypothetical protein
MPWILFLKANDERAAGRVQAQERNLARGPPEILAAIGRTVFAWIERGEEKEAGWQRWNAGVEEMKRAWNFGLQATFAHDSNRQQEGEAPPSAAIDRARPFNCERQALTIYQDGVSSRHEWKLNLGKSHKNVSEPRTRGQMDLLVQD